MAQLGDTVITGSLAVSNCIYGSVTCATCSTTSTNACKGWNGSAFATFGTNAFNSTAFTTCTGTVTSINIYCGTTCICGITSSGSICLGSNAFNSTAFTTCTGTVTQVKVGSTAYNPTSGVICLPNYPSTPKCVCCAQYLLKSDGSVAYKVWIVV